MPDPALLRGGPKALLDWFRHGSNLRFLETAHRSSPLLAQAAQLAEAHRLELPVRRPPPDGAPRGSTLRFLEPARRSSPLLAQAAQLAEAQRLELQVALHLRGP